MEISDPSGTQGGAFQRRFACRSSQTKRDERVPFSNFLRMVKTLTSSFIVWQVDSMPDCQRRRRRGSRVFLLLSSGAWKSLMPW